MKKRFAMTLMLLALILVGAIIFASCDKTSSADQMSETSAEQTEAATSSLSNNTANNSQNNTNNNTNNAPSAVTTVSEAKWKNAFNLSRFDSFTLSASEIKKRGDYVTKYESTVKYNSGILHAEFSETEAGIKTHSKQAYITETPKDLGDLYSDWLRYFIFELEDTDDMGYSLFTYSAKTASYTAQIKIMGSDTTVDIWFSGGNIVKIAATKESSLAEYSYTYRFTSLDATETVVIPTSAVNSAITKIRSDIASAKSCSCISFSNTSSDELLKMLKSFAANMTVGKGCRLEVHDGKIFSLGYECDETTQNFMGGSVTYDSVTVYFDNGKLDSIELRYYTFYVEYEAKNTTPEEDTTPPKDSTHDDTEPETEKTEDAIFAHQMTTGGLSPTLKIGDTAYFERVDPKVLAVGDIILFKVTTSSGGTGRNVRRINDIYDYGTYYAFSTTRDDGYEPIYVEVHQDDVLGRYTGMKH